jgi:phosphoserine phosphatase
MPAVVTLVSPSSELLQAAAADLLAVLPAAARPHPLGPDALDLPVDTASAGELRTLVAETLACHAVDVCVQPQAGRRKRLLVADMDSTIISCECLDELADYAGVKAEIAAVTERAMRGELEFEPALRERVARLRGLPVEVLQRCYDERVRLNPGAATLVRTMVVHGGRAVLVSGGFEFFTGRVAAAAGFSAHRGNRLVEADGRLTGEVADPILGRQAKLDALRDEAGQLGADLAETVAIGDGANDLAMIEASGLGVAYRAKPVVAERAAARVEHADLTALLYFQGFRREQFAAI